MKNKGITLIALIVTIVILLILAGISISFLMGDNGILNKAKTAQKETSDSGKEEENRLSKLNDLLNGGTSRSGYIDSPIISGFNIKTDSIGALSIVVNIDGTISTSNNSKIYGYAVFIRDKLAKITETLPCTIPDLTLNTQYDNIYVIAIDENFNFKKSTNTLSITTLNMNEVALDYPMFTKNGVMNVKFVNPSNSSDFYYGVDLSKDCTASDALDKQAYDSNESTYYDPTGSNATKNKFRFGSDIDVYQCSFKVNPAGSGTVFSNSDGSGYILYSEGALYNTDWFHTTYYGKGSAAWRTGRCTVQTKVYEMKYDSSL